MRNWIILIMKPAILVGGQAVIEGVMMRVPGAYATAVREIGRASCRERV